MERPFLFSNSIWRSKWPFRQKFHVNLSSRFRVDPIVGDDKKLYGDRSGYLSRRLRITLESWRLDFPSLFITVVNVAKPCLSQSHPCTVRGTLLFFTLRSGGRSDGSFRQWLTKLGDCVRDVVFDLGDVMIRLCRTEQCFSYQLSLSLGREVEMVLYGNVEVKFLSLERAEPCAR